MTGWQVGRRLKHSLRRDDDGRLVLPLWIGRGGEAVGVSELVLTTAEAEQLHAALCYALDGEPVPDFAPDCRYSTQRGPRGSR